MHYYLNSPLCGRSTVDVGWKFIIREPERGPNLPVYVRGVRFAVPETHKHGDRLLWSEVQMPKRVHGLVSAVSGECASEPELGCALSLLIILSAIKQSVRRWTAQHRNTRRQPAKVGEHIAICFRLLRAN